MKLSATTRKFLVFTVLAICVFALAVYLFRHGATVAAIWQKQTWQSVTLVLLAIFVHWGLDAWRDTFLLKAVSREVPFGAIFRLNASQRLLNNLPLQAGTIYKASHLKLVYRVDYTDFASVLVVQAIFVFVGSNLVAGLALWIVPFANPGLARTMGAACWILAATALAVLWAPLPKTIADQGESPRSYLRALLTAAHRLAGRLQKGLLVVRSSWSLLLATLAVNIAGFIVLSFRLYILFSTTDTSLTFAHAMVFAAMAQTGTVIAVTPASFGIREGLLGLVAKATGHGVAVGVVTATFERALMFLSAAGVAGVSFFYERNRPSPNPGAPLQ